MNAYKLMGERIHEIRSRAQLEEEGVVKSMQLLEQLGIVSLLELATHSDLAWETYFERLTPHPDWSYYAFVPIPPEIDVWIWIPYDRKHEAIAMLTNSKVDKWNKSSSVRGNTISGAQPYYYEMLLWTDDPDGHSWAMEASKIRICFYKPTQAGEQIGEHCVVEEKIIEHAPGHELVLTCKV